MPTAAELGTDLDKDTLEGDQKTPAQVDPAILETIKNAAKGEVYAQIMQSDPEIAKLLQMRAAGKQGKVVSEEDVARQQHVQLDQQPAKKFEDMTEEEKYKFMAAEAGKSMIGVMNQQLAPLKEQLQQINQYKNQQEQQSVNQQIEDMKKKHPDFNSLIPRMQQLTSEHPKLNVTQLYSLAASEAGSLVPAQSRTGSERPSNIGGRPTVKRDPAPTGVQGMRDALRRAAQGVTSQISSDFTIDDVE